MIVRLASCQYPIDEVADLDAWRDKVTAVVADAAGEGAQLLVFPEYAGLELAATLGPDARADLAAELAALQPLVTVSIEHHRRLAREHGVWILAGSLPERVADGRYVNRARFYGPEGGEGVVDKQVMTRFEAERWGISPGQPAPVFDTPLGRIGVAICYDAEFPMLVRRLVVAGAQIILVPSNTEARSGWSRVRIACQARALESQCFVAHAVCVGAAPWSHAIEQNVGAAAVFAPPDRGLPDDGVVAGGPLDQPGWVFAELDLELLAQVRADGQVLNHRDWDHPGHLAAPPVAVVTLT